MKFVPCRGIFNSVKQQATRITSSVIVIVMRNNHHHRGTLRIEKIKSELRILRRKLLSGKKTCFAVVLKIPFHFTSHKSAQRLDEFFISKFSHQKPYFLHVVE
jgi:hypothetical protein